MAAVVAVFSILAVVGATLTMVVILLAGAPNSKPEHWIQIKMLMLGMGLVRLIGLVGAVWAMVAGRHWLAARIGITPAAAAITMFTVLMLVTG